MYSKDKPFKRGFPDDFPIRPANLVQLDWMASTRNMINMWLPETIACENHGMLLGILREEASYHFSQASDGSWTTSFEKLGVLTLEARITPVEEGVQLSLEIGNASRDVWEKVRACVCVQFHAAPDFYDPERKRTFYLSGGQLRTLEGPYRDPGFYGPGQHPGYPQADASFIGINSEDGRHVVALWWQEGQQVFGNAHRATLCVHTDPAFQDIAPGESAIREGRLYLMQGTQEDALRRFRDDSGLP